MRLIEKRIVVLSDTLSLTDLRTIMIIASNEPRLT
jgi:hypothetical protein